MKQRKKNETKAARAGKIPDLKGALSEFERSAAAAEVAIAIEAMRTSALVRDPFDVARQQSGYTKWVETGGKNSK
jgi:hypothetical protein